MRTALVVASIVLVAGACGSPADQAGSGQTTGSSLPAPVTSVATTAPDDTQPGERPPGTDPEDGQTSDRRAASQPLSIEDALLPDDALGAPWEFQWRNLDSIGYGAGPNQTDCDAYWAYETLLGGDGGHAMWWADGGNANHRVIRNDSFGSTMAELGSMVTIALQCPVVRWNEGGSFTTELFDDVDVDALIMRFIDEASGEVTWVAVTVTGDLISLLQMPLWTRRRRDDDRDDDRRCRLDRGPDEAAARRRRPRSESSSHDDDDEPQSSHDRRHHRRFPRFPRRRWCSIRWASCC